MEVVKVQTLNIEQAENSDLGKVSVAMDDAPITDNYDLWRALDAAEKQMHTVIMETNKYKYIRKSQQKANRAIFGNLKKLVMDYVKSQN